MAEKFEESVSKKLSYALRHKPESLKLTLDKNGWAPVAEVLANAEITIEQLKHVVDTNDKKRFAFNEDHTMIRASQGHSITVELNLKEVVPPKTLYHGTADRNVSSIMDKGIIKGSRQHVHLSATKEVAISVGKRHGRPILIEVDANKMKRDGLKIYQSENGVYLTDIVPSKYLKIIFS